MGYDDVEERIKKRAHEIWEREGRPHGRDREHWIQAKEEIAIEDRQAETLQPNPSAGPDDTVQHPEPVEPVSSVEVQGENIGPTAQSDEQSAPVKRGRPRSKASEGAAPAPAKRPRTRKPKTTG